MNNRTDQGLLPAGLKDILPPEADHEAKTSEALLTAISRYGYERVKPPLVEFEDGLLSGQGSALSEQTFRLMDPISDRMMAIRSDVTPQVSRIATTRLSNAPRPLRLCYSSDILRVRGNELRPERQFCQVGFELIGPKSIAGDVEIILLASECLNSIGVKDLSIDLNVPTLVTAVLAELNLPKKNIEALQNVIDRKDESGVRNLSGDAAETIIELFSAVGSAPAALDRLSNISLPPTAKDEADRLIDVARLILESSSDFQLTIDPLEHRSFEYHTGISFTLFGKGVRGELGRGGRYTVHFSDDSESATGCTLYLDSVVRAIPVYDPPNIIFIPAGNKRSIAEELHASGWVTIIGLDKVSDVVFEARRLKCTHVWIDSSIKLIN
tara:strand:+ start:76093 stop:77241 length:1149 start_codon:yes stop_codon:yes gene_type:complete